MKDDFQTISGNIVDVLNSDIYPGTLKISGIKIADIIREDKEYENYIIPGLIDSHIHIESSMLIPSEFARAAVIHGTVATVSDPHEIANILGIAGIDYMIENGRSVPFKFFFGAPSCVPATKFETSGAELGYAEIEGLLKRDEIKYLSEVMNYPAVICNDAEMMSKIALAKKYGKSIDGHAPRLKGMFLEKYAGAGITTDHESFEREEAISKIKAGMKILIREGSAARNFNALSSLINDYPESCMFCSDDKHPDDLVKGHINGHVKRAVALGFDIMKVLKCACVNPVRHYGLEVGLLQKGDFADFVVIDNFNDFNVLKTYINGRLVAENGKTLLPRISADIVNNFNVQKKETGEFSIRKSGDVINIIDAVDGQLMTNRIKEHPKIFNGCVVSDHDRDILKIAVINRYKDAPPAAGFVKNFGLKKGAIAASMAHDSHNIIVAGTSDEEICRAVNLIIENKGGISAVSDGMEMILPLPVAGIMSADDYSKVAEKYIAIDKMAKSMGSRLHAPFTTLSFMALLVIPKLKLSDRGLFDSENFEFIDLFEKEKTSHERLVEMEDDAEYQRQLALFVGCSTEKSVELVKIGEIIAGLPARRSFLDIGAGGGNLTIPVSQSFLETTVIEPNEKQSDFLRRRCPHFKIYHDTWENTVLGSKRYDFILCSHVLYYIEEGRWLSTVEKMFSHLEDGGCIAIILQSPIGEVARFFNRFTAHDVNVLDLWRGLIRQYGEDAIDVRYFINEICTESLDEMVDIGLFLLLDRRYREKKDEIREYFETYQKTANGYRIIQDEILFGIKKRNKTMHFKN
jgi:adenine deaminase